ncbi:hypothetical protein GCM10007067_22120 [Lysobacter bugurensis]|uniref:DUF2798 domain-containing protein n=2 Tax=Cognatilysobacter bugurensis TaxID=543356 RepID=A0A918T0Z3_9GAMM|nr:hypothetical protein GCM10007067_22120 [Lysobacter bugurensis]
MSEPLAGAGHEQTVAARAARWQPACLATFMSAFVAAVVTALNTGVDAQLPARWLRAWAVAWPAAVTAAYACRPLAARCARGLARIATRG